MMIFIYENIYNMNDDLLNYLVTNRFFF